MRIDKRLERVRRRLFCDLREPALPECRHLDHPRGPQRLRHPEPRPSDLDPRPALLRIGSEQLDRAHDRADRDSGAREPLPDALGSHGQELGAELDPVVAQALEKLRPLPQVLRRKRRPHAEPHAVWPAGPDARRAACEQEAGRTQERPACLEVRAHD